MQEELKIKVKLEFNDFLNFQFWHLRKRYLNKFIFFGIFFLLAFVVVIPIIFGIGIGSIDLLQFVAPFIFIILFPVVFFVGIYYAAKKSFYNDRQIQKEQEYIFDLSGFQFSNENSQTKLTWNELFRFEESKKNLLIYCSPAKCFIIPKKQLLKTDIDSIREKLGSNVKRNGNGATSVFPLPFRIALILVPICIGVFMGLQGNKSDEYFEKGYTNEQKEDYKGAIIEFSSAIDENPSFAKAYNHRGYAKGMLGDFTGELEDCSKAIDLDKHYGSAYYNRGDAKYFLDDSIGACTDYHKALDAGYKDAKSTIEEYCK